MRWVLAAIGLTLCACGGAPFTVEFATADDGGQAIVHGDAGMGEDADAGVVDPPEAAPPDVMPVADAGPPDSMPDTLTLHRPDAGDAGLDGPTQLDAAPECTPGTGRCVNGNAEQCSPAGFWGGAEACGGRTCTNGSCGVCIPNETQCVNGTIATCDPAGLWGSPVACPNVCECAQNGGWVKWPCTESCPSSSTTVNGSCASATACM